MKKFRFGESFVTREMDMDKIDTKKCVIALIYFCTVKINRLYVYFVRT